RRTQRESAGINSTSSSRVRSGKADSKKDQPYPGTRQCQCTTRALGAQGRGGKRQAGGHSSGAVSAPSTTPNQALEPTPHSVRSAPAIGRGSPPALGFIRKEEGRPRG